MITTKIDTLMQLTIECKMSFIESLLRWGRA